MLLRVSGSGTLLCRVVASFVHCPQMDRSVHAPAGERRRHTLVPRGCSDVRFPQMDRSVHAPAGERRRHTLVPRGCLVCSLSLDGQECPSSCG